MDNLVLANMNTQRRPYSTLLFLAASVALKTLWPTSMAAANVCPESGMYSTNVIFVTVEGFDRPPLLLTNCTPTTSYNPAEVEKLAECRPEALDLEGNWGAVSEGFRLSLRFPRSPYTNGTSITAVVLLRNVCSVDLKYRFEFPETDFRFEIYKDGMNSVPEVRNPWRQLGSMGVKQWPVYRQTQRRFEIKVDKMFDLPPGDYVAIVKRAVPRLGGEGSVFAESGKARFQVLASRAPSS